MQHIFKPSLYIRSWIWLLVIVLTACSPSAPATVPPTIIPSLTALPTPAHREAQVQSVEVQISQANPPQVSAVVHGNLTESCATLGESQVQYISNAFQITVYLNSPADLGCIQSTTPFDVTIPLDTRDLPAGNYTVTANGMKAAFKLPIENPTPSLEPTLAMSVPTNSACIDSAAFITDVTIPDNSVLDPNTAFTKTWRIKNTGTCTWDSNYLVTYISGATMSQQPGYWIVPQGQTVAPGETVDINVGMTSPAHNGSYVSYWGLKKENGQLMPVQGGVNYRSFYVKIEVHNGVPTSGNITAASIAIEPEQGSGPACTADSTYFVHASITTDAATSVVYEIDSSAGQTAAGFFQSSPMGRVSPSVTGTLSFDQAATKAIDLRFVGPYPYPDNITVLLWVNHGDWYQSKLSCDAS